jgi:4-carboxymuconolactone decarboxylase
MARISLIEEAAHPELGEYIAKVKAGRGKLLNVYKLLLHSPDIAMSWLALNSAVRWESQISDGLRELAIIRIARLNGVDYIVRDHVPSQAVKAGLTAAQCEALAQWEQSPLFDAEQRAVLAYADAMTLEVAVPDRIFAAVKACFTERQIVDLTVLIGAYNMQTRVLRALQIDPEMPAA